MAESQQEPTADAAAEARASFDKRKGSAEEIPMSAWIRMNKALLVTAGAITTAGGTTVAWIIEHIDDIEAFVERIAQGFGAPSSAVDVDAMSVAGESLPDALDNDPVLIAEVERMLAIKLGSGIHIRVSGDRPGKADTVEDR